MKYYFIKLKQD